MSKPTLPMVFRLKVLLLLSKSFESSTIWSPLQPNIAKRSKLALHDAEGGSNGATGDALRCACMFYIWRSSHTSRRGLA